MAIAPLAHGCCSLIALGRSVAFVPYVITVPVPWLHMPVMVADAIARQSKLPRLRKLVNYPRYGPSSIKEMGCISDDMDSSLGQY